MKRKTCVAYTKSSVIKYDLVMVSPLSLTLKLSNKGRVPKSAIPTAKAGVTFEFVIANRTGQKWPSVKQALAKQGVFTNPFSSLPAPC